MEHRRVRQQRQCDERCRDRGDATERPCRPGPTDDPRGVDHAHDGLQQPRTADRHRDARHERRDRSAEDLHGPEDRMPVGELQVVEPVVPRVTPSLQGPRERLDPVDDERDGEEQGDSAPTVQPALHVVPAGQALATAAAFEFACGKRRVPPTFQRRKIRERAMRDHVTFDRHTRRKHCVLGRDLLAVERAHDAVAADPHAPPVGRDVRRHADAEHGGDPGVEELRHAERLRCSPAGNGLTRRRRRSPRHRPARPGRPMTRSKRDRRRTP